MTRLLKKGKRWEWGDEQDHALQRIRAQLTTAPTLVCSDFEQPFVLRTDASSVGLGAVLTQKIARDEEGNSIRQSRTIGSRETILGYGAGVLGSRISDSKV